MKFFVCLLAVKVSERGRYHIIFYPGIVASAPHTLSPNPYAQAADCRQKKKYFRRTGSDLRAIRLITRGQFRACHELQSLTYV